MSRPPRPRWHHLVPLIVAIGLSWAGPARAERPAFASGRVSEVRVEGANRIEDAAVLAAALVRPGDQLTPDAVRRDIRAVFKTGYFRDVVVDVAPAADGGVVVTFKVVENPAVREVRITGADKVDEDDIDEVVDIDAFAVLNDADVRANVQRIRDLYLEKGYFLAEVDAQTKPVDEAQGQVDLVFAITENRKVLVQTVDVTGNTALPDRKVKRFLQTKEAGVVPWLTQTGTFRPEIVEEDTYVVRQVYLEEGYVDVEVGEPKVFLSPDKRFITVSMSVEEGPRYRLGAVGVSGDFVPEEALTEAAALRIVDGETPRSVQENPDGPPSGLGATFGSVDELGAVSVALEGGDWFRLSDIQAKMEQIADLYRDQGYAFASVVPLTETREEGGEHIVDLTLDITRGEKYRVGRIDIAGNDPTFDKTVRREVPIDEGAIYNGSALKEARARLERLGFFEEVRLTTPRGTEADTLDVKIEVIEQQTGSFQVGAGFSSLDQFVFTGNVSKQNFLGLGYSMSAAIQWSANNQQGNLSFADPHFLDTRWTLRVDAYSIATQYTEDQYQRGGGLDVGRYLDEREDLLFTVGYTFEDRGLRDISAYQAHLFGGRLYADGLTSTVGFNLVVDKRNNRIKATQGALLTVNTRLSGGFEVGDQVVSLLGGDFNLWETKVNLRYFQPVIPNKDVLVFRMNSSLGLIKSTDGSLVPYIHRYRAGGIQSMRGYGWFTLGPSIRGLGSEDPTRPDDRLIVGGTEIWVTNFELESPIVRAAGISAVVFFDAGNAFGDPYGEGHIALSGMRFSYGAGIRWFSPIGPLRFELGFPVNPYPDERPSVFDFSIGSFF